MTFRPIWVGVRIRPQGKPHHPSIADEPMALSLAVVAQRRQQIAGVFLVPVMTSADQTVCDVCTSIGPR